MSMLDCISLELSPGKKPIAYSELERAMIGICQEIGIPYPNLLEIEPGRPMVYWEFVDGVDEFVVLVATQRLIAMIVSMDGKFNKPIDETARTKMGEKRLDGYSLCAAITGAYHARAKKGLKVSSSDVAVSWTLGKPIKVAI